jgi:hypothetical protein
MTLLQFLSGGALAANLIACGLLIKPRTPRPATLWQLAGGLLLAGYCGVRCWSTLPLMPLHLGLPALAAGIGLSGPLLLAASDRKPIAGSRLQQLGHAGCALFLNLLLFLFPKDFYLPFIRSLSPWPHLMLWFGVAGRVLLLAAAIDGAVFYCFERWRRPGRARLLPEALTLSRWGFACLTLSLFAGELWSYLGWGCPMVWHDPAVTTAMAVWLYWVGALHLHYIKGLAPRRRALLLIGGGLLILTLGSHPDLGPLRLPGIGPGGRP